VRGLRPRSLQAARAKIDPWQALDWLLEEEHTPEGDLVPSLTIFLAGSECPFTCVFCDLWQYTLKGETPAGAIPAQIQKALLEASKKLPQERWKHTVLKLYNASNFFEIGAVPPEDDPAIVELVSPFGRVVVECHPRLVGERCFRFAEGLEGKLEVAMGLETVHPRALPLLSKGVTLDAFDEAAGALAEEGIDLRCFVLLGSPYVEAEKSVEWTVTSVRHALALGARHVSVIPVRPGEGALEELERQGHFKPPTLEDLEDVLDSLVLGRAALEGTVLEGTVTADLWDLERLASCNACWQERKARLEALNQTGQPQPPVICAICGSGGP